MNKFKEFDYIQTPDDWKDDLLCEHCQKKKIYSNKLVIIRLILLLCFSSFGVAYAYNEEFRSWIYHQFQMTSVEEFHSTDQELWIENSFLYYYHNDNDQMIIDSVYVLQDGKYVKQKIKHKKGIYQKQDYSFDYVRYQDQILTFNEKGYIQYTVPYLNGDTMYFGSSDTNLCSLDLKNQDINKITYDNDSVNFFISPKRTYILINKNDKYWTVYNTKTQTEKVLNDLNPYAHSNEHAFLSDEELLVYNSDCKTSIINLKTLTTTNLNVECIYPAVSTYTLKFDYHKTIITDVYQNKQQIVDIDLEKYDYNVCNNRFIIFHSLDDKKIVIVDFYKNKMKVLDYLGTNVYIGCFITEEKYLTLTDGQDYYIISLSEIF